MFGAWHGKDAPEMKHFSVKRIRGWIGWCEEGSNRFALQREEKDAVPTFG